MTALLSFKDYIEEVWEIRKNDQKIVASKLKPRQGKADAFRTANDEGFGKAAPGKSFIPNVGDHSVHPTVKEWHKENIDKKPGHSMTTTHAYMDYCAHCEEKDHDPISIHEFKSQWQKHSGHSMGKIGSQMRHLDVKLRGA
jgi:hypothetical protein